MARGIRKSEMKEVPLSEVKDDLSRYLREAETTEIVITRHGKPAGVPISFDPGDRLVRLSAGNRPEVSPPDRKSPREPARRTECAPQGCAVRVTAHVGTE